MPTSLPPFVLLSSARDELERQICSLRLLVQARYPFVARMAIAAIDPGSGLVSGFVASDDTGGADGPATAAVLLSQVPSLWQVADTGTPRVLNDLATAIGAPPSRRAQWLLRHRFRSSYTVPIALDGTVMAFLFFDASDASVFTDEVTRFLDSLAEVVAELFLVRVREVRGLMGAVRLATRLAQARDIETGNHLRRMAAYASLIADGLASRWGLDSEFTGLVKLFAPLHDIGKVGIPDRILRKPGALDPQERAQMQMHVEIGGCLVDCMVADLHMAGSRAAEVLRNVVVSHHERGDGSGYPTGSLLRDIALESRIVAVADVYDAISSARPYKGAWTESKCSATLLKEAQSGRLDPDCVEVLIREEASRVAIRRGMADADAGQSLPCTATACDGRAAQVAQ